MNYFELTYHYSMKELGRRISTRSCHIIKAKNIQKAIRVIAKSDLTSLFPDVVWMDMRKLDMSLDHNKAIIKRRKQGHGGIIWLKQ